MTIELKVPMLPESVADATITTWHKKPGDQVNQDENLVDLETDKVVLEVPAPQSGVLEKILEEEGATVTADQVLAVINENATTTTETEQASDAGSSVNQEQETKATSTKTSPDTLSPAVRRLVAEHNVDVANVHGSGKDGRITKDDVLAHMKQQDATATTTAEKNSHEEERATETAAAAAPGVPTFIAGDRPEQRVPMTRLRARIAERLVAAQRTAAILTTFNEINMQAVITLRNKYRDEFEKVHGIRLGFMSFFVKAAVEALKRFPAVNASIDGEDFVYHGFYDVGVAVSSPRGLVVPVVRDADQKGLAEIEKDIADYATKARDGKLTVEEMTGGTFTISNGGIFGSLMSTPILNPPQSGILGMHKIEQRPVVEHGEIVVRPMMYVALSYDHRIIDGRESVTFLVAIKQLLEDPARLLLEM